jgi:small subunit ribosomal protein S16
MATALRLQRHGKKGKPHFHIIVADSRSPRDGKYIERIGKYNPTTQPATIEINFEKALDWIKKGAQPSDTVRAILAYKGVLFKNHLDRGVIKGAHTQEQANARFEKWLKEKEEKISGHVDSVAKKKEEKRRAALKAEADKNAQRAAKISAKSKPAEEKVEEAPVAENNTEETPAE